jgi:predicted transcriptional regulator
MSHHQELTRILTIIADLTHHDTNSSIKDTDIIAEANSPSEEVEKYLNELQSRGFIKADHATPSGVDYRTYRITQEGIHASINGFH